MTPATILPPTCHKNKARLNALEFSDACEVQKHAHLLQTLFQQLQITTTPPSNTHRSKPRPLSVHCQPKAQLLTVSQRTCISMHRPHFNPNYHEKGGEATIIKHIYSHEEGWQKRKHGFLSFVLGRVLGESLQFRIQSWPCFTACQQLIGPLL